MIECWELDFGKLASHFASFLQELWMEHLCNSFCSTQWPLGASVKLDYGFHFSIDLVVRWLSFQNILIPT